MDVEREGLDLQKRAKTWRKTKKQLDIHKLFKK